MNRHITELSHGELERAHAALNEIRSYISAVHPGSEHPVWDALDTVRAALAQQPSPNLSYEDFDAWLKQPEVRYACCDDPKYADEPDDLHMARHAWCAALTQQAQPEKYADEIIRLIDLEIEDPSPSLLAGVREQIRLAQQAQTDYRCVMCNKPIPVGCKDCTEYALDSVGFPQQAQPLTDEEIDLHAQAVCDEFRGEMITSSDLRDQVEYAMALARDRTTQQAQPKMPTPSAILEAVLSEMEQESYSARTVADAVLALFAKETPQQAQPEAMCVCKFDMAYDEKGTPHGAAYWRAAALTAEDRAAKKHENP